MGKMWNLNGVRNIIAPKPGVISALQEAEIGRITM
jgi:hypothetical protein